jgi:GntR family transcriptional regulator
MLRQRYEQVADDLRSRIQSGQYAPGTRLPSRAQLREIYQVSDTVSDKALKVVRREGLIETLSGVGVFVRDPDPS